MKVDEIVFFIHCYVLRMNYGRDIGDIVNDFEGLIHHKRCRYLLKKWAGLGFYNYGVSLDLGWFESPFFMPERYRTILEKIGAYKVKEE